MTNDIKISRELADVLLSGPPGDAYLTAKKELRALLAAPVVESQEPVAWMRKWAADGVIPEKVRNENGRMAWPFEFKLIPVSQKKCLPDDVALHKSTPAPVAVVLPADWQDQLFAEMERRFGLRKHIDDDRMAYDDTQIGVEFARDWVSAYLDKAKELNQ